ncbi:MAG: glycosyltransferase family 4 protein [Patescibacteria group bacterium]
MKILITTGIFPPDIGGPARMVERLSSDLAARGHDITVLTFGKEDKQGLVRTYKVVKAEGKTAFLFSLLKLARKTDLIYTFDLYTAGFLSWFAAKLLFKKKLAVRFAGDSAWESAVNKGYTADDIVIFQSKKYGLKIWWKKKMRTLILQGADKVVAVSNFMKDVAVKIGVDVKKISVIYNSVDFVDFNESDGRIKRERLGFTDEDKIVATAGRLVPWKGVDGLIGAAARLKNENKLSNLKLLIIGDGHDRGRLEELVKARGMENEVKFVGRAPLEKVFQYYNLADVFVLNSQYEGLSHILLEALSLGKPIVASNCGGNPEVIENEQNGLLIEYNNVDQLAAAIKRMLIEEKWQSDEFRNICKASLLKFNWERNVEETVKLLHC